MNASDDPDPRGLIRESYRIDGIGAAECRSIFLDWAISVPNGAVERLLVAALLERHEPLAPDHPMTQVLREALAPGDQPRRKGGARGRRS